MRSSRRSPSAIWQGRPRRFVPGMHSSDSVCRAVEAIRLPGSDRISLLRIRRIRSFRPPGRVPTRNPLLTKNRELSSFQKPREFKITWAAADAKQPLRGLRDHFKRYFDIERMQMGTAGVAKTLGSFLMISAASVALAGCTLGPDFLRPSPPNVTGY